MTDVVLLIDLGNTRLKWVLARGGEIQEPSAGRGDLDDFSRFAAADTSGPSAVVISSVAAVDRTRSVVDLCRARWAVEPRLPVSRSQQGGVVCAYAEPASLGVDRWLAIVGAVRWHGKPVVIWDLGTATTLDAVDGEGRHLGGQILPGPATMLASLREHTQLRVPESLLESAAAATGSGQAGVAPGTSTASCIGHGVLAAQLGALNQFMRHVALRIGSDPKLVVTGGAAGQVLPLLRTEHVHDPWLVFHGMLVD